MRPPIVKVRHEELEQFLTRHGKLWVVDGNPAFEECLGKLVTTPDEIVGAAVSCGGDSEFVYVFSDDEEPYTVVQTHCPGDAPEKNATELDQYIIKTVKGKDFLYVASSLEEASNGSYVTILPWPEEEAWEVYQP